MKVLKIVEAHTNEELIEQIRNYKNYNDIIDWKIIQAVKANTGLDAQTIAKVFCISIHKVYSVIEQYNKKGKQFKQNSQWGGRRRQTSYMSIEEESTFLEELSQKAQQGEILTAKDIKKEIEKRLNHNVSEDYIWKIFKRHNWSKKAPRPEHPKTDYTRQEEFKKNSQRTWQPPS